MVADLTPFGFTGTENAAYSALLELGPSGAYAIARRLSIARANAYQALDGLVAKRAASQVGLRPRRYRATQPQTLLASIIQGQAARLDQLEKQMGDVPQEGERPLVQLTGARAVRDAATRAILRASQPVRCLGSPQEIEALAPAIRARIAGGRQLSVWTVAGGSGMAVVGGGLVPVEAVTRRFAAVPLLLVGDGALAAAESPAGLSGYWGSDPVFSGTVSAAIDALVTSQPLG
jgi:hypothetical protein